MNHWANVCFNVMKDHTQTCKQCNAKNAKVHVKLVLLSQTLVVLVKMDFTFFNSNVWISVYQAFTKIIMHWNVSNAHLAVENASIRLSALSANLVFIWTATTIVSQHALMVIMNKKSLNSVMLAIRSVQHASLKAYVPHAF